MANKSGGGLGYANPIKKEPEIRSAPERKLISRTRKGTFRGKLQGGKKERRKQSDPSNLRGGRKLKLGIKRRKGERKNP